MAHTSPFHRRKWAGYLSGYRIFPALVVLLIVPFGGEWHIPSPWDGEIGLPAEGVLGVLTVVMLVCALLFGRWDIRIGRVEFDTRTLFLVLAAFCALGLIPFGDDRWHIGGVDGDVNLNGYMLLFVLTALAPYTDVLDGHFAAKYPRLHEEDFFLWSGARLADGSVDLTDGKKENDMPNAFYFIVVPLAIVLRLFLEWVNDWESTLDSGYMLGISLVLGGVLLFGTLVFERLKATAVEAQAKTAELMQGWLAGLFYFLIPLAFAILAFNHWSWVWQTVIYVSLAGVMLVLFYLAQDRWLERPESVYPDDVDNPQRTRY